MAVCVPHMAECGPLMRFPVPGWIKRVTLKWNEPAFMAAYPGWIDIVALSRSARMLGCRPFNHLGTPLLALRPQPGCALLHAWPCNQQEQSLSHLQTGFLTAGP
eukprot:1160660-Pelagomonas_calceolata.AAC.6